MKKWSQELEKSIDEIRHLKTPDLFNTIEINGLIFKHFSFLSRVGELDINKLAKYEIEKIEAESFGTLYLMKKEYEEQLELKHKHVEKYWKTILLIIKAKLKDQVSSLIEIDESNFIEIKNYLSGLRYLSINIFRGQDLATSLHIIRILYRERLENKLDLDFSYKDIIDSFQLNIESINRVHDDSKGMYLKYLAIQSKLYKYGLKEVIEEINSKSFSNSEMKQIAEKIWYELKEKGISEDKIAEEIEKKINYQVSKSTIKRWLKPEYNRY